ncbi:hypothetical protein ACT3CD_11120 [Geofilum sp. OHC36d9]|uniref:hypothetical protein n=1 Tax=Geofilum sp. OHC36d9 TaxID=3458413 RepID=UPI004033E42E
MKKMKFFAMMAVAILMGVSFTACEEDEASISIAVDGSIPAEVTVGTTLTFNFNVVSDNKIETIKLIKNNETIVSVSEDDLGKLTYSGTFSYNTAEVGTTYLSIEVTDKKGNVETKSYTVEVIAAAGEIDTYTAKLLGSYEATPGSFFATTTGLVYKQDEAKTNSSIIDFVYYYGTTKNATIAAPNDEGAIATYTNATYGLSTWATKNSTKFAMSTVSASEFDAMEDDAVISEEENVTSSAVAGLEVNDVAAFTTAAGKKGLFKVVSVSGTGGSSTIEIDVKVQK